MSCSVDQHTRQSGAVAVDGAAITTYTTTVGNIIATEAFESLEFYLQTGAWTDGTYTLLLEEGDDSGLSDAAVVPTDFVLGTLGVVSSAQEISRTGYVGKKAFVRASIVSASTSTGATLSCLAVEGDFKRKATTDQ